jgi:predicted DCC family thiol-disulfide oxidoreductase YuxK
MVYSDFMDDKTPGTASTTVYYNSACPVCDAGICYQRARMDVAKVDFIDVNARPEVAAALGIDLETLRERLHVRDAQGHMQVGDQALAALWVQTRGQRWLATLIARLRWLTGPLYKLVARCLYRWNRARGNW